MLRWFASKKKADGPPDPRPVLERLAAMSPPSALVRLCQTGAGLKVDEELGRAFLLRRDKQVYSDGTCLYITAPDGIKADGGNRFRGRGEHVALQFLHRRVPHRLDCRVLGRYRLLPEVVETLDFRTRSAYKLQPLGPIRKQDKRGFLRYALKNYSDARPPVVGHIDFDLFLKPTNKRLSDEGAPPVELADLRPLSSHPAPAPQPAAAHEAMEAFRRIMGGLPNEHRRVFLTKVATAESSHRHIRPREEVFLLGEVDVLGIDKEMQRDVVYTRRSPRCDFSKNNPYNLRSGDRVLVQFRERRHYYNMACEVLESRTRNEVLRPRGPLVEEDGLAVELAEFSASGALIESSPQLLRLLLGAHCPPDIETRVDFSGRMWDHLCAELGRNLVHLTFYPRLNFPEKLDKYRPELPFSISIVAQFVRPYLLGERRVLQFGLRFAYDAEGMALFPGQPLRWKLIRGTRDNAYFIEVHSKLSQLYSYLENQSLGRLKN